MRSRECPTDLLAKERRVGLSLTEQHTLEHHLVGCHTCRALRQLGQDFDAETTVLSHDEATIDQIAVRLQCKATGWREPFHWFRRMLRRSPP